MKAFIFWLYIACSENFFFLYIYYYSDTMFVVIKFRKEEQPVFDNSRYLTCGVDSTIPIELQLFMWECVERLPEPKDYLQVFELKPVGNLQCITHTSEEPEYCMEYLLPSDDPITEKLYVIDDDSHSTMLLSSEY